LEASSKILKALGTAPLDMSRCRNSLLSSFIRKLNSFADIGICYTTGRASPAAPASHAQALETISADFFVNIKQHWRLL
jgi:hypothetical protein